MSETGAAIQSEPHIKTKDGEMTSLDHAVHAYREASINFAGSPTGQSVSVARYCRKHELNPMDVRMKLQVEKGIMEKLALNASGFHRVARDSNPHSVAPNAAITGEQIEEFMRSIFTFAQRLMILPDDQLAELAERYKQVRNTEGEQEKAEEDEKYGARAEAMISEAKRKLNP